MKTIATKLNCIFNIATYKKYSIEEIEHYEELYKTEVMEELADFINEMDISEEEKEDLEISKLVEYNPNNLCYWYETTEKLFNL